VPKRLWFQDSLDAIVNILNNEQDYLEKKAGHRDSLDVSSKTGFFHRKSRQLRRLLSPPRALRMGLGGSKSPLDLPVANTKTCWIVCGPESSGSVLIAKTISHAIGASKQFSDYSGYGYNGDIGIDNLVLHRSVPFLRPKKSHHDLLEEINQLKSCYNIINYILTTRDPLISLISKSNRFGGTLAEGNDDLDQARDFFVTISSEPTCFIWNYETMLLLGDGYFRSLYRFFDIDSSFIPGIKNANSKYILPSDDLSNERSLAPAPTPIVYYVNFFLKNGELPDYISKTIASLLNAINHSPLTDVVIIVMVDSADYKYFKRLFKSYASVIHVRKLGSDSQGQRLPKLRDILCYEAAIEIVGSDKLDHAYCIYANADICIPTFFFGYINQQVIHAQSCRYPTNTSRGIGPAGQFIPPDSFVINRRDYITDSSDAGHHLAWHPGSDLFVFPMRYLSTMQFGDVTIGLPPVGPILWLNLLIHSKRTLHVSDSFISWHHGNDQKWKSDEVQATIQQNTEAAGRAFWHLINGDKSILSTLRYEESINSKNLRSKANLFASIGESMSNS
jgi:hypothetical protein